MERKKAIISKKKKRTFRKKNKRKESPFKIKQYDAYDVKRHTK
jgi:hypothetical protein